MYDLPHFKATNFEEVEAFMLAHPFITLCGIDVDGRPIATQIPVLLAKRGEQFWLRGHIMRKTDHHLAFEHNRNVLAIFTGPNSYVSASWYTNQKVGSTFNYLAVHAHGLLHIGNDEQLLQLLHDLTHHFENNPDSPSLVKHLPAEYVEKNMKAIVAIEIEITQIRHVFKLSQNRDEGSFFSIIEKLSEGEGKEVAAEMKKWKDGNH